MGMTYSDLSFEVAGMLQIDTTDRDKFQVQNCLNRSQLLLLNILPSMFLVNSIKTTLNNLASAEGAIQHPTLFIRLLNLWVDYDVPITDTNIGFPVKIINDQLVNQIANKFLIGSQSFPIAALNATNGWELRPVPDANVVHGWRMKYVYRLPTITGTQPCLLRENLRNLLIFVAASFSAAVNNYSPERSDFFWNRFKEELLLLQPKAVTKIEGRDGYLRNFVNYTELLRNADRG